MASGGAHVQDHDNQRHDHSNGCRLVIGSIAGDTDRNCNRPGSPERQSLGMLGSYFGNIGVEVRPHLIGRQHHQYRHNLRRPRAVIDGGIPTLVDAAESPSTYRRGGCHACSIAGADASARSRAESIHPANRVFGALSGGSDSTLVIDPGAVFVGAAVAGGGSNTLELSGTAAGTLSGLGTEFKGFSTLREDFGSNSTLADTNVLGTSTALSTPGSSPSPAPSRTAHQPKSTPGGKLTAISGGTILIDNLTLSGGALTGSATGSIAIGSDPTSLTAGHITVETGATISGFGYVNGRQSGH